MTRTRKTIAALTATAALTLGIAGTTNVEAEPAPQAALPRCAFNVVVIAPGTNLNCSVYSDQRLDIVGITQHQCNQYGGGWGWRLQRCFNVDH